MTWVCSMAVSVDITNYFFTSDFNFGTAAIASSLLTFPTYSTMGIDNVLLLNIEESLVSDYPFLTL